jgi:hypothetical protein
MLLISAGQNWGDLHKNNPLWKKTHETTLRPNYSTSLTVLCGALAKSVTPFYVASVEAVPHIVGWQARAATMIDCVAPLRKTPHPAKGT